MEGTGGATDVLVLAEGYRRARDLTERMRVELVDASIRDREVLNLKAVARAAGVDESNFYKWIKKRRGEHRGG